MKEKKEGTEGKDRREREERKRDANCSEPTVISITSNEFVFTNFLDQLSRLYHDRALIQNGHRMSRSLIE